MGWLPHVLKTLCSPQALKAHEFVHELPSANLKVGEQTGKLSDPQGKRVYHEYFVGEDRGDGHFEWSARVYSKDGMQEKHGVASSKEVARQQANTWAHAVKDKILEAV